MHFRMSFHFQNVVLFWKRVFIFKMWKVLWVLFFSKNIIVNRHLQTKICAITSNSFTDEVVLKNNEIYIGKLSRIYNLLYLYFETSVQILFFRYLQVSKLSTQTLSLQVARGSLGSVHCQCLSQTATSLSTHSSST